MGWFFLIHFKIFIFIVSKREFFSKKRKAAEGFLLAWRRFQSMTSLIILFVIFLLFQFPLSLSAQCKTTSSGCYCSCCQGYGCSPSCVGSFAVSSCTQCTPHECGTYFTECEGSSNYKASADCYTSYMKAIYIGCVAGAVALIVIGFSIYYCCCRKQQDSDISAQNPLINEDPSITKSYQSSELDQPQGPSYLEKCGLTVPSLIFQIIIFGVAITFIMISMGVAGHILGTSANWKQNIIQGLTDQNTFCFSKEVIHTYGVLLLIPSIVQLAVLFLLICCCVGCNHNMLLFLVGLITSSVVMSEGSVFVNLGNEGHVISSAQCPIDVKGESIRVDGFFLKPMAIIIICIVSVYALVVARSILLHVKGCRRKGGFWEIKGSIGLPSEINVFWILTVKIC